MTSIDLLQTRVLPHEKPHVLRRPDCLQSDEEQENSGHRWAGFICSHLAEASCEDSEVVIIDGLSTCKLSNINALLGSEKVKLVGSSITAMKLMRKLSMDADLFFHHAARPSAP